MAKTQPAKKTASCENCLSTTPGVDTMCRGCLVAKAAPQKDKAPSHWLPQDDKTAKEVTGDHMATVASVRLARGLRQ